MHDREKYTASMLITIQKIMCAYKKEKKSCPKNRKHVNAKKKNLLKVRPPALLG